MLVVLGAWLCQECLADLPALGWTGTRLLGRHLEEEEEEKDMSTWIYVGELLLVMVLALLFEKGQETMNEKFAEMGREGEQLRKMFDVMSNEIMILGFISLLVYVCTKTEVAKDLARLAYPGEMEHGKDELAEHFELVHMLIFAVMVAFVLQCLVLMYRAVYLPFRKWVIWENTRVGSFQVYNAGEEVLIRVKNLRGIKWVPGKVVGKDPLKVQLEDRSIITAPIWTDIAKSANDSIVHKPSTHLKTIHEVAKETSRRMSGTMSKLPTERVGSEGTDASDEGADSSMAHFLQENGYADASGTELKPVLPVVNPWWHVFSEGQFVPFLQWRLMRHDFMFPAHNEGEELLVEKTGEMYAPPEPQFFSFNKYLFMVLGRAFEELVEVDLITWVVTALLACFFPLLRKLDKYWYTLVALICNWTLVVLMYFFAVHVYHIYNELTVYDEDNPLAPKVLLKRFKGTSANALTRKHRAASAQQKKNEQPALHRSITVPAPDPTDEVVQLAVGQSCPLSSFANQRTSPKKTTLVDEKDGTEAPILGFLNMDGINNAAEVQRSSSQRSVSWSPANATEGESSGSSRNRQLLQEIDDALSGSGPALDPDQAEEMSHWVGDMNRQFSDGHHDEEVDKEAEEVEDDETRQLSGHSVHAALSRRFAPSKRKLGLYLDSMTHVRPWYLNLLSRCGVLTLTKSAPDQQDLLFWFHEASPAIYNHVAGDLLFFQSVMLSLYLALWFMLKVDWTLYQYSMFALGLTAPTLNLFWLAPKLISKLCIIQSVGFMKDKGCVEQVILDAKKRHMLESVRLLQVARLAGKIQRIADKEGKISEEKRKYYDRVFEGFSVKKKQDIKHMWKMFDEDDSGTIDFQEMKAIFESVDPKFVESAEKTWAVIDADNSGYIEWSEFRVLMALVFHKGDETDRREDIEAVFESFDDDNSGEITIPEMTAGFKSLGVDMDESSIAMMVTQVFRQSKRKIAKEDFVRFLEELEEMAEKF